MNRIVLTIAASFCFLSAFAQTYQSVESVEYDASQNRWLVSNGSSIIARASTGELSYFGNATATYGMEVMGNALFAVSNGAVKAYDLETAEELMSISIPGTSFLNGMTNDGTNIYVTDFGNSQIFKIDVSDIDNPQWERIVDNTGSTPNGIIHDAANNRLIYVNWGSNAAIKAVDLTDNTISTLVSNTGLGNIDGIDEDAAGNYYIASWSPNRITKYDNDFENSEIITTPFINSPADIGYSQVTDTLAIPVGNNVVFVGFDPIVGVREVENDFKINLFPNPVEDYTTLSFVLENNAFVQAHIVDINGRLYQTHYNETLIAGQHRLLLTDLDLPKGQYICRLLIGEVERSILFIKE